MAGAVGGSGVGGIGLQTTPKEPDITVRTSLGRSKVYIRRTHYWKEAVAEFTDPSHAEFYADALRAGTLPIPNEVR